MNLADTNPVPALIVPTLIKICGVRDRATAECAANAGADFVGVVMVESSARFVAPALAIDLANSIRHAGAIPVAVVALPLDDATRAALRAFDVIQFHGRETPDEVAPFARELPDCALWKGLHFSADACAEWMRCGHTQRLVIDGMNPGSGASFDHRLLAALDDDTRARCFLAGGLDATNVAHALRVARVRGVDVSSGVESSRGVKDHGKIRAFIDAVRQM